MGAVAALASSENQSMKHAASWANLMAQTAAVLSTADDAQQLLTAAKDKWNACADRKIVAVFEVITLSEGALGGA